MISILYEKKLRKDLFRLSILTLITTVVWIGISTYRALSKSEVKPKVKKQLIPLTPSIELDTMKEIKQRRQVPEMAWESLKIVEPELPEILVVSESEASGSGGLDDELIDDEATSSGSQ